MKVNVANPATGAQKLFDYDDERKTYVCSVENMESATDGGTAGSSSRSVWVRRSPPTRWATSSRATSSASLVCCSLWTVMEETDDGRR